MKETELLRPKQLIGATVRLTRQIATQGGSTYPEGSLWEIYQTWRGLFSIKRVWEGPTRCVFHVSRRDFEVVAVKEVE